VLTTSFNKPLPKLLRRVHALARHRHHVGRRAALAAGAGGAGLERRFGRGSLLRQPGLRHVPAAQGERGPAEREEVRREVWRSQGLPGVEEEHAKVLSQDLLIWVDGWMDRYLTLGSWGFQGEGVLSWAHFPLSSRGREDG